MAATDLRRSHIGVPGLHEREKLETDRKEAIEDIRGLEAAKSCATSELQRQHRIEPQLRTESSIASSAAPPDRCVSSAGSGGRKIFLA